MTHSIRFASLVLVAAACGVAVAILTKHRPGRDRQRPSCAVLWSSAIPYESIPRDLIPQIESGLDSEVVAARNLKPEEIAERHTNSGVPQAIVAHDYLAQSFRETLIKAKYAALKAKKMRLIRTEQAPLNLMMIPSEPDYYLLMGSYLPEHACLFRIEHDDSPEAVSILRRLEELRNSKEYVDARKQQAKR